MEQEYFNLTLLQDPEGQNEFIKAYASSNTHRRSMHHTLLTTDAADIVEFPMNDDISNSASTVRAMFAGLGITMTTDAS